MAVLKFCSLVLHWLGKLLYLRADAEPLWQVRQRQLQQAVEQHDAEAVTEASKLFIERKARPSLMAVWFNAW
jgi:hypothetical protein